MADILKNKKRWIAIVLLVVAEAYRILTGDTLSVDTKPVPAETGEKGE